MVPRSSISRCAAQFCFIWVAAVCCGRETHRNSKSGSGLQGLLDSLVAEHRCPATLPTLVATPPSLSRDEVCALVDAARKRLGRELSNLPNWDPADTERIARAGVYQAIENQVDPTGRAQKDSSGFSVAAVDTLLSVEFDVPGRPRLIRVIYRSNTHHEEFGAVHRGPM
jgi:hypothetical protein